MFGLIRMDQYGDDENVTWTIGREQNCTHVLVKINHIDTEKNYDFLQIGGNRYSGNTIPQTEGYESDESSDDDDDDDDDDDEMLIITNYGFTELRAPLFIGFTSDGSNSDFGGFILHWKCSRMCVKWDCSTLNGNPNDHYNHF